jgi:hypothetical protein
VWRVGGCACVAGRGVGWQVCNAHLAGGGGQVCNTHLAPDCWPSHHCTAVHRAVPIWLPADLHLIKGLLTDALDVAGRPRLHRLLNWYSWYNRCLIGTTW